MVPTPAAPTSTFAEWPSGRGESANSAYVAALRQRDRLPGDLGPGAGSTDAGLPLGIQVLAGLDEDAGLGRPRRRPRATLATSAGDWHQRVGLTSGWPEPRAPDAEAVAEAAIYVRQPADDLRLGGEIGADRPARRS